MDEMSVHIVSCATCGNIAMIGCDDDQKLYFLCLVCNRVTPLEFMQEEIRKGAKLRRIHPDRN